MAVDVIQAKPTEYRVRQLQWFVAGVAFAAIALAPYPQGYPEIGYMDLWPFRLMVLVVVVPLLYRGIGLFRPVTLPVLEIRRDSIRYSYAGEEFTVARAAVAKAWVSPAYLNFAPALDEQPHEIILRPFDKKTVKAALERQGWT